MKFPDSGGSGTPRWLPPFLALLLVLPPNLRAQQPNAQQQAQPAASLPMVQSLKVIALAGDREMNDLERHIMAPLVVQVLDQNSRPVEGAQVIFRFPLKGPSAEFPNQQSTQTVTTNADGQAAAVGWQANREMGRFQVQVTASRLNELGEATIAMINVARIVGDGREKVEKPKRWWSSKWVKIGVIAGAAGVVTAIVIASRGGVSGGGNTTVTASPGAPTIGGPH